MVKSSRKRRILKSRSLRVSIKPKRVERKRKNTHFDSQAYILAILRRITKSFKKYFIPHRINSHKPHFLRNESVSIILAVIFIIELYFLLQSAIVFNNTDFFASVMPNTLTFLTNDARKSTSLPELTVNPILEKAAMLKAEDMAQKGYFSHNSPDGLTPWYWFKQAGYKFTYAGENLAVNFSDSADVNNAWMASPAHRANILNKHFTEIGIGTAKGIYKGKETIFIVEFFGKPKQFISQNASAVAEKIDDEYQKKSASTAVLVAEKPQELVSDIPVTSSYDSNGQKIEKNFVAIDRYGTDIDVSANRMDAKAISMTRILPSLKIDQLLSMPRALTNYLYSIIFLIVFVALILKILIKIKIQYPILIANGVFLLFLIYFTVLINRYLGIINASIY